MRRRPCHLVAVAATLATAVCLPATAAAQGSTQVSLFAFGIGGTSTEAAQISAHLTGEVVVNFHGDQATGCAIRGLCGYAGTILWSPARSASLGVFRTRSHGRRHDSALLFLNAADFPGGGSAGTDADVSQTLPALGGMSPPITSCGDVASGGASIALSVRRGLLTFSLSRATPDPLVTRCAGPLLADVSSGLAAPTVTLRAALHGAITLDLSGVRSFASHGFAGSVDSTLRIRLGRPRRNPSSTPPGPSERYREVLVSYRAALAGSASAVVSGAADQGLCAPLGACGLHGTLSVVPPGGPGLAQLTATGPATRPQRDFLTALGLSAAGRARGITVNGEITQSGGGVVTADLSQGSASCQDSTALGGDAVLLAVARGRIVADFLPGGFLGGSLRTRCPGPASMAAVAAGSALLGNLSRRIVRLSLHGGQTFLDDGYDGTSTSHLALTLTRRRVRTSVFRAPQGSIG